MNTGAAVLTQANDHPNTVVGRHLNAHWPLWAWTIVLLLVNLPLIWGQVRTGGLFWPHAVCRGEWWRIATYPLVHLSWYHLLLDAGGFLLLYACLEEKRGMVKALYVIGPGFGTLGLSMAVAPAMDQQGLCGLSGIAHGLMAITAMEMLRHKDQRPWGMLTLGIVVAKSTYELLSGQVVFEFMHMGLCGRPLAASHAGGVVGGLFSYSVMRLFTRMANTSDHQIIASSLILFQKTAVPFLARIGYRIHYRGLNHIPVSGPAVLICNHVSYVDWLVIAAGCQRPVRFVMHASIYRTVLWHWFFRWAKVIPIDTHRKNPAVLRAGLREIDQALRSGGLVCIFPEGRLTRNGRIGPFRKGIEAIIRRNPVPVVPLALHGLWGSFFSHQNGPAMRSRPHKFRPRVELVAGSVVTPHKATADHLHRIVQNLYHGMDRNEAKR